MEFHEESHENRPERLYFGAKLWTQEALAAHFPCAKSPLWSTGVRRLALASSQTASNWDSHHSHHILYIYISISISILLISTLEILGTVSLTALKDASPLCRASETWLHALPPLKVERSGDPQSTSTLQAAKAREISHYISIHIHIEYLYNVLYLFYNIHNIYITYVL